MHFLMNLLHPYLNENNGDGGDAGGGGGSTQDRGDNFTPLGDDDDGDVGAKDKSSDDDKSHDDKSDDDKSDDDKSDDDKSKDDDKARDDKGRFQKKDQAVPKSRFDEAVRKEREAREAAEARAAEAEAKLKQEQKSEDIAKREQAIEDLEAQHAKLLLDGKHDEAAKVMKQIRHSEREIARIENEETSSRARAQAVEEVRMDAAIANLESKYPQFNKESEEFDQDLVDLTLAEQVRLIRTQGMSPSEALTRAGIKIMEKFAPKSDDGKSKDDKGLDAARKAADDRRQKQVEKNLDTSKRQAPSTKESGMDSDRAGKTTEKIDVSKLTKSEFDALPAATRARLRGDEL